MSFISPPSGIVRQVRQYRVCWEVWPEYAVIAQKIRQVGFELELLGSSEYIGEFDASSPRHAEIDAALEAIARWTLQRNEDVRVEISHNGQSLCYSPARGNRPDVALSIKILHRNDCDSPVDENERNYLEITKARLRQLGACEHRWYSAPTVTGGPLAAA